MVTPRSAAQVAVETPKRYVKVTWSDDGRHVVEVKGFRRRAEVERLLKAAQRHMRACQTRGIPIDTAETQRPTRVDEAESLAVSQGR